MMKIILLDSAGKTCNVLPLSKAALRRNFVREKNWYIYIGGPNDDLEYWSLEEREEGKGKELWCQIVVPQESGLSLRLIPEYDKEKIHNMMKMVFSAYTWKEFSL